MFFRNKLDINKYLLLICICKYILNILNEVWISYSYTRFEIIFKSLLCKIYSSYQLFIFLVSNFYLFWFGVSCLVLIVGPLIYFLPH